MNSAIVLSAAARSQSPGLWTLAWRRFRRDRVGMISMVVVLLFIALTLASAAGLVAHDWMREVGVSYAPPTFVGPDRSLTEERVREGDAVRAPADDIGIPDPLHG